MKTSSFARHILTWLGGFGTTLATMHWINADQAPAINDAATALGDPLLIIIGLVGALLTRVAIAIAGNLFRQGTGEGGNSSGPAGGLSPCIIVCCMAAGFMGLSLPSCTPVQIEALRAIPIRIGIQGPDAALSYSSKGGLAVEAVVRAEK